MGELIGPRPLAIDRLREFFFPDNKEGIEKIATRRPLGKYELFNVTYLSLSTGRTLECELVSHQSPVASFRLGESGLEEVNFHLMVVGETDGKSKRIRLQQGIQIEPGGAAGSVGVVFEDLQQFREFGEELADWAIEAIRGQSSHTFPLKAFSLPYR